MTEKKLNPESHGEEAGEGDQSRKRIKTGTGSEVEMKPLVGCGGGLKDQVAGESLFLCSMERYWDRPNYRPNLASYQPWDSSYVVRSINLPDLLTSSSSEKLELRELARMDDKDLPGKDLPSRVGLPGRVGCGVLGSKIVFASGLKPNFAPDRFGPPFGPANSTDVYAFDIHDHEQGIVKMPGALNEGKDTPLVVEFAGKLYVLSYKWENVPFEVFDPQQGTWSVLPSYPYSGLCYPLSHASYVIAGTKLFMSTRLVNPTVDSTICCFDFAARDPEWRRVPSLGGYLPIAGQAVAVELPQPEHRNKRLLFSARVDYSDCCGIVVHLMSLDENQETMSEIFQMNLPDELPHQPWPNDCHFFHLGGNNVFLVTTARVGERTKSGIYTGGAVLFQFEFDMSKVDTDRKNCFTIQFQPPRIFEYHSSPDCMSPPHTLGCFLL